MAGYRVDVAQLCDADARLAAIAADARAALGAVRASADELLGTGWTGPAATAFGTGWSHWLAGMTAVLDALDELAVLLGRSGAGYAETELGVRREIVQATS